MLRVIFTDKQDSITIGDDLAIMLNGKIYEYLNSKGNTIIMGKHKPLNLMLKDDSVIYYPKTLIHELVKYGTIAFITKNEVLCFKPYNIDELNIATIENVECVAIPRKEMNYVKIKGINA